MTGRIHVARAIAGEHGVAVFLTMGVIVLLSALTMSLVMATSVDSQIAAAFRNGLEASAAAEAGAHHALVELAAIADWSTVLDGSARSTYTDGSPAGIRRPGGVLAVDLDLVRSLADCGHRPPCSDAERDAFTRARPWGPDNPRWQLFAYGPLDLMISAAAARSPCYLVVLVADDPGERDGNPSRDSPASEPGGEVVRVRAEAFCPAGAHRTVELMAGRSLSSGEVLRAWQWHYDD